MTKAPAGRPKRKGRPAGAFSSIYAYLLPMGRPVGASKPKPWHPKSALSGLFYTACYLQQGLQHGPHIGGEQALARGVGVHAVG